MLTVEEVPKFLTCVLLDKRANTSFSSITLLYLLFSSAYFS